MAYVVQRCPSFCDFDWEQFIHDLDRAVAHFINEAPEGKPVFIGQSSIMDLITYAAKKEWVSRVDPGSKSKDKERGSK